MSKAHEVPKIRFLRFWQKNNQFICTILLKYESANGLLTFCKNYMSGKNLFFWVLKPQDCILCSISQTRWDIKCKFMWLDIHRSDKFIQSFQVGVGRHTWAYEKLFQIVCQLHRGISRAIKLFFFVCGYWIHRSYKFVQSIQAGVANKYSYGCSQVHLGMPKIITNIKSEIYRLNWALMLILFIWVGSYRNSNWFSYFKQFNSFVLAVWLQNYFC